MFKFNRIVAKIFLNRNFCSITPKLILEHQTERSLISVVGEESSNYLQGLITNDIQHIEKPNTSQYAMFLNSQGRIMCDSIIYRIDENTFFIECDRSFQINLERHLKVYKIKRKIQIESVNDFQVYTMFDKNCYEESLKNKCPTETSVLNFSFFNKELKLFRDPRLPQLGYRVLTKAQTDASSQLSDLLNVNFEPFSELTYKKFRYCLGIGEGTIELPNGNCFPLENNCDYLHGVSFHKGCYIGQELTARTYHTGVIRKRLMPIYFKEALKRIPSDDTISYYGKKIGKLRGIEEDIGLALIRLEVLNSVPSFKISEIDVVVGKPFWWAIEAPKVKLNVNK